MFAVPGWSVSADGLKAEKASPASGPAGPKSRKRKRDGAAAAENVTASNVADLYESVVEGKKGKNNDGTKKDQASKRQRKDADGKGKSGKEAHDEKPAQTERSEVPGEVNLGAKDKNDKKKKQKEKKKQAGQPVEAADEAESTAPPSTSAVITQAQLPKPAKLTPLQAYMREKLVSARFRHLNETLYTRPSDEAFGLFQDSPEMFDAYHEGFRRQVKVWPENPVDSFLEDIRTRAKLKLPGRGKPGAPPTQRVRTPLPRTTGICTIADLGCGDARLAESLQADKAKLRLDVKSYDLQSPSPLITRADIANLPLEDGSVNVAIFCLALMGTNWIDFIEEAYRILHWKGELWVAEIKSRFGPVRNKHAPVDHSVGNRKKAGAKKGAKAGARDVEDDALHGEDLAVEVDGMEDRRRETDVSAFVDALRKRGFVLQGERNEAVDLSNRMFVKMHFTKGASPTKGKGAKPREAPRGKKGFAPKRDEEGDDDKPDANEAAILKPCVYKIR
ncbi:25S rRNA (adenine(645)-N(1))-methyltransferase [Tolypocladium ophioglossoides CBS 100239]|uniref:Ribosomal RNA-processing protein 8 n=1 Tax=Tolypocladium ophioglossoides (strain CBS 100239) TaxID=1163406 RepID=A0A0L0NG03_TOLOC|nr:25S rRNA (adenine(645)-N(1))-methyltransferase [Tolypocladium ophioglossoides CBS 100239]